MNSDIRASNLKHLSRLAGLAPDPGLEHMTADHHLRYRLLPGVAVGSGQDVAAADEGTRAVVGYDPRSWILEPDGGYEGVTASLGLFTISVGFAEDRIKIETSR